MEDSSNLRLFLIPKYLDTASSMEEPYYCRKKTNQETTPQHPKQKDDLRSSSLDMEEEEEEEEEEKDCNSAGSFLQQKNMLAVVPVPVPVEEEGIRDDTIHSCCSMQKNVKQQITGGGDLVVSLSLIHI